MTRYLIAGAGGMLGTDLQRALQGRDVSALPRAELDITDPAAVRSAVRGHDVVFNAAAYTNVDAAESDEAGAMRLNAEGAGNLASAAASVGAVLVQFSTDYVFDGKATTPYAEDAPVAPVSVYGRSKAEGERLALELNPGRTAIIRTAWLYGEHGGNFVTTMLRLAGERDELTVVTDQVGQPTWTLDLAKRAVELVDTGHPAGIFHGTNSGQASWWEFAREIFVLAGLDPDRVKPTDSTQFTRPAPRPDYSVLGSDAWSRVGLSPMRHWRDALREAFATGAWGAT